MRWLPCVKSIALFTLSFAHIDADIVPPKETWVDIRSDGRRGNGTCVDPYDGSTQAKFDAVMSSLAPSTCVHLGAGIFLTRGIVLKEGSHLIGLGKDLTTVKLADETQRSGDQLNNVISYWGPSAPLNYVEISDMTLDANRAGQPTFRASSTGHAIGAILCYTRSAKITNVRAQGTWGSVGEAFVFALVHGGGNQPKDRIEILHCENLNPVSTGNGISGICAYDQDGGTFSGFIRECVVTDNLHGTGVSASGTTDFIIADNYVANVYNGTNFDTYANTRLDIHGNHYDGILGYGILYNSGYVNNDIRIHDNLIVMAPTATSAVIHAGRTRTRSFIYDNLLLQNSANAAALIFGPNATGEIRNNVVQENVATDLGSTKPGFVVRDNHDLDGRHLPLGKP